MSGYFIRPMKLAELKSFFNSIKRDFSRGEYAPYDVLYQQLQSGIQEGLVFCDGERDLAYSICAAGHENGYVLISLLAVFEEYRGQGIGSAFMKAIGKMYEQKRGAIYP